MRFIDDIKIHPDRMYLCDPREVKPRPLLASFLFFYPKEEMIAELVRRGAQCTGRVPWRGYCIPAVPILELLYQNGLQIPCETNGPIDSGFTNELNWLLLHGATSDCVDYHALMNSVKSKTDVCDILKMYVMNGGWVGKQWNNDLTLHDLPKLTDCDDEVYVSTSLYEHFTQCEQDETKRNEFCRWIQERRTILIDRLFETHLIPPLLHIVCDFYFGRDRMIIHI
jgi:hypothetical protein